MRLCPRKKNGMTNITRYPKDTRKPVPTRTHRVFRLFRLRDRGGMAVLCAVMIPSLLGLGTLAIDQGYYGYRKLLLVNTVEAAALAAGNKIGTYYSTGGSAAVVAAAQTFATLNMPTSQYGTVVTSANVVLGNLNSTTQTFTSLAASHGTSPNAVQVTGLNTAANGNSVPLFLGSFFGRPSADVSSTVIAANATGQSFNAIILNDMSDSFSSELANQRAIDTAILNCVKGQTGTTSQFGIILFNGLSTSYQDLQLAGAQYTQLQTKITALSATSCGKNCGTGSNVASGIYAAIQALSDKTFAGQSKNIILITDGVPNANSSVNYGKNEGIYPTGPSDTPTCKGKNDCTDADLLTMARNQAADAAAAGISISTVYYSGSTATQDQASYAASVASLVTGKGLAMVAPTSAAIGAAFGGFCATIPSSAKIFM
jgi:Flp pilus assembly protein TadG